MVVAQGHPLPSQPLCPPHEWPHEALAAAGQQSCGTCPMTPAHWPPWPLQALRSRVGSHRSDGTRLPHATAQQTPQHSGLVEAQELGIRHPVLRRAECARLRESRGEPTARSERCLGSAVSAVPSSDRTPPQGAPGGSGRSGTPRAGGRALVAQPLPWVLEPTAFEAAEPTASDHIGAKRESQRSARCRQTRRRGGCE